jgi:hypothetical protein
VEGADFNAQGTGKNMNRKELLGIGDVEHENK